VDGDCGRGHDLAAAGKAGGVLRKTLLVVTPWKRRWELGDGAGLADDYYFIKGFVERGFDVHYVGPRDEGPPDVQLPNYAVHGFPDVLGATERWPSILRRPLWPALFTMYAVRHGGRLARRIRPDFVLGQTHLSARGVHRIARSLGVPSAVKLFGVENLDRTDWSRWKYVRKNFEQVRAFKVPHDAWLILDDGSGGAQAALRHGVPRQRIHELPNGVNLEWADRAPRPDARRRFGLADGANVVLYLARLIEWKRPDLFIRTMPRILELANEPIVFVIAGEGRMRRACEALAGSLGVAEHIRFTGAVPHDLVPDLMELATVFVSTNERSNAGIPTCEALVCGVPVVAYDLGSTRRFVLEGETGRLIQEGDLEGFAGAVAELLNDQTKRRGFGNRARRFALANFTGWPERVAREVDIVDGLLNRRD
jgi:glycosyltransferase involved in cell wall biosynthesis